MHTASCDSCLGSDLEEHPASHRGGRPLLLCRNCGLVIASPLPSDPVSPVSAQRDARHDPRRIARIGRLLPRGRILEIGCDEGTLLAALDAGRYEAVGIEPASAVAARAQQRLESAGVRGVVIPGTLGDARLESESFDMVVMIDSLARNLSPRALLMEVVRLLRSGGIVLIETPRLGSLTARLLGARWAPLGDPAACYFFTPASLTRLTATCGLLPTNGRRSFPPAWPTPGVLVHTARKSSEMVKTSAAARLAQRVGDVGKATPLGATQ